MSHLNFSFNYTSHLQKEEREKMKKKEKGEKIVYKFVLHLFGGIFVLKNVKKKKRTLKRA